MKSPKPAKAKKLKVRAWAIRTRNRLSGYYGGKIPWIYETRARAEKSCFMC